MPPPPPTLGQPPVLEESGRIRHCGGSWLLQRRGLCGLSVCPSVYDSLIFHFPDDSQGCPQNAEPRPGSGAPDVDFPDTWWPHAWHPRLSAAVGSVPRKTDETRETAEARQRVRVHGRGGGAGTRDAGGGQDRASATSLQRNSASVDKGQRGKGPGGPTQANTRGRRVMGPCVRGVCDPRPRGHLWAASRLVS